MTCPVSEAVAPRLAPTTPMKGSLSKTGARRIRSAKVLPWTIAIS